MGEARPPDNVVCITDKISKCPLLSAKGKVGGNGKVAFDMVDCTHPFPHTEWMTSQRHSIPTHSSDAS